METSIFLLTNDVISSKVRKINAELLIALSSNYFFFDSFSLLNIFFVFFVNNEIETEFIEHL